MEVTEIVVSKGESVGECFFLEALNMLPRPRLRAAGRLCCWRLSVHLRTKQPSDAAVEALSAAAT